MFTFGIALILIGLALIAFGIPVGFLVVLVGAALCGVTAARRQ